VSLLEGTRRKGSPVNCCNTPGGTGRKDGGGSEGGTCRWVNNEGSDRERQVVALGRERPEDFHLQDSYGETPKCIQIAWEE